MSTGVETLNTGQQAIFNYDTSKIFIGDNKYFKGNVAASGADIALVPGMVMGRITATGKLAICKSGNTDGSQVPVGILKTQITVADGTNEDVNVCYRGDVAKGKIDFDGTDTWTTEITKDDDGTNTLSLGILEDLIRGIGINPVPTTENTAADNS